MDYRSTITHLKAAIEEVEAKKRRIDEQHSALITALDYFQGMGAAGTDSMDDDHEGEQNDVPW